MSLTARSTVCLTKVAGGVDVVRRELDERLPAAKVMMHYYKNNLLSRFYRAICPDFGTGIRLPGQKVDRKSVV